MHMKFQPDNLRTKFAIALAAVLTATPCFAHGQQVLGLPLSNGVALVSFVVFLLCWRQRALFKGLAFCILRLGILFSWLLASLSPGDPAEWPGYSFGQYFAFGLGVPIAVAWLGCLAIHRFRNKRKSDA